MDLNKVMLGGRITRDIELKYLTSGQAVAEIGIATNRRWKDKQTNEEREEVTFVDCTAFGRTAEVMSQYLGKGRPVLIEGRMKLDQWQAQDGSNRSKLKVIIDAFHFVDSKSEDGGGQGGQRQQSRGGNNQQQGGDYGGYGDDVDVDDDDVPF